MRRTVLALAFVSLLSFSGCTSNGYYYGDNVNSGTGSSGAFCSGDRNAVCLLAIVGVIAGAGLVFATHN
jgi:hypothetical protein